MELPKDKRFCEAGEIIPSSSTAVDPSRSFRIDAGKLPEPILSRVGPEGVSGIPWRGEAAFRDNLLAASPRTEVALALDRARWILARSTPETALTLAETDPSPRAAWSSAIAGLPGRVTALTWNGSNRIAFVGESSSSAGSAVGAVDLTGKLIFSLSFTHTAWVSDFTYDDAGSLFVFGGFRRSFTLGDAKLEPGPPHTDKRIVPRLGVDVAVSSADGTVTQEEVVDGFIARIDANGRLAFLKPLHSGMTVTPGALVGDGAGVVFLGSVVGSLPESMKSKASDARAGKWTVLARMNADGSLAWTRVLEGASYGHRLAKSPGGYIMFMGVEDRACEAIGWSSPP